MGFIAASERFHAQVFLDGDRIIGQMLLQFAGELRAGGFGHGNEVFNIHGVFDLSADAIGNQGHGNTFARRINGRRTTRRTAANHHYILHRQALRAVSRGYIRIFFQQFFH